MIDERKVRACSHCGSLSRDLDKHEHFDGSHVVTEMPNIVAIQLQKWYRIAHPPKRLTCTPTDFTLWVEELLDAGRENPTVVLLRPERYYRNEAAISPERWLRLPISQWRGLNRTIEGYTEAITKGDN